MKVFLGVKLLRGDEVEIKYASILQIFDSLNDSVREREREREREICTSS
jgi:hypothetical protein